MAHKHTDEAIKYWGDKCTELGFKPSPEAFEALLDADQHRDYKKLNKYWKALGVESYEEMYEALKIADGTKAKAEAEAKAEAKAKAEAEAKAEADAKAKAELKAEVLAELKAEAESEVKPEGAKE